MPHHDPVREKRKMRTQLIHGDNVSRYWDYSHHVIPPLSSSSTFRLDTVTRGAQGFFEYACDKVDAEQAPIFIYDRLDEPTRGMLEDQIAHAEGGARALCFASGMAAISAGLGFLVRAGQEIVSHHTIYGCTYSLLTNWMPRFGVPTRFCDVNDPATLRATITPKTRIVYFETPVNPTLELIDIRAVCDVIAEENQRRGSDDRIYVLVDNTFASPYCQRPLEHGADIVIHSLTKNICGFGTDMGGAVVVPERLINQLALYRKDTGGVLSSKAAWPIMVYGLSTLHTRMEAEQKSAKRIAEFLSTHSAVEEVIYPGLPGFRQRELAERQMQNYDGNFSPSNIIYFRLKDASHSHEKAATFVDHIAQHAYTITLAVSLGQIKTLIESPFTMTHSALPEDEKERHGVDSGGIRLAVGLEDRADIIHDLDEALLAVERLPVSVGAS